MNRSRIEYCDHTLNIITGCRHGCDYCYARQMTRRFSGNIKSNIQETEKYRMADGLYILDKPFFDETGGQIIYPFGFEPTFHRYRFDILDKLKMGNIIFVGAMADIFGAWIPDEWIKQIMDACISNPIHNYLFLTKNPERYIQYGVPTGQENLWYGTTITCNADSGRIASLVMDAKTFVSIEPLQEHISSENIKSICKVADWIIIGAETGRRKNKIQPEIDWIKDIVSEADNNGVPVFMKDSLMSIVGKENMRREYPELLKRQKISSKVKERLFTKCAACGKELRKNQMLTISVRKKRGGFVRSLCHVCEDCFKQFCDKYDLPMPELEEDEDGEEKSL